MDALIKKAEYLNGEVKAPGSKSYTHRVIAAASLYGSNNEEILIENPSTSDANEAMIVACNSLGADISWTKEKNLKIKGVHGNPKIIKNEIDVGNSGTALRIAIALASLAKGQVTITGDASLSDRPTKPLIDALNRLGSNIHGVLRKNKQGEMDEYAPITIDANGLNGGSTFVHDGLSSQYLTSLLFVSNFAKNDVEVNVFGNIVSKPYIKMTLEVLDDFGINVKHSFDYKYFYVKTNQHYKVPTHYKIPGDYSQAAFLLAAACLVDSDITIKGLSSTGEQGDKQIITILRDMGAKIDEVQNGYRVKGSFDLEGTEIDLLKTPDLFPVLSILGIYAKGKTRLYNMPQIRSKETDRIAVIERELRKYGIKTESEWDEMTVYQTDMPEKAYDFNTKGAQGISDHRIAMALSLIGIRSGCAIIREINSIRISYPNYLDHLHQIGVETKVVEEKPENEIPQHLAM